MTHAQGEDFTQILPSPDATVTTVQPFPALRDAMRPSVRTPPPTAYGLPLWRAENPTMPLSMPHPAYGYRELMVSMIEDAGRADFQEQFLASLARVLGRRLYAHEATPGEVLEIIEALV